MYITMISGPLTASSLAASVNISDTSSKRNCVRINGGYTAGALLPRCSVPHPLPLSAEAFHNLQAKKVLEAQQLARDQQERELSKAGTLNPEFPGDEGGGFVDALANVQRRKMTLQVQDPSEESASLISSYHAGGHVNVRRRSSAAADGGCSGCSAGAGGTEDSTNSPRAGEGGSGIEAEKAATAPRKAK